MEKSKQTNKDSRAIEQAAEQLIGLVRTRVPVRGIGRTVGEIVDGEIPWENPEPFTRSLIWEWPHADQPERMAATIRSLLDTSTRASISTAHLLEQVRSLAFDIGEDLLDHRDHDRSLSDARRLLPDLVKRLKTSDERWDIVLPIVNLWLHIEEPVHIGPVLLVREGVGRFVVHDDDSAVLGEFGLWAVEHFDLHDPEKRRYWSGTLGMIGAYGKVVGLRGDHQAAIQRAKQDVDTALAILRVSYYLYGSWSGRERYGTFGSFYDPIQRFGVMGSTSGGLRITLTAKSDSGTSDLSGGQEEPEGPPPKTNQASQRQPGVFTFQMNRTDLMHPVEISNIELSRRWPIIEQLAAVLWAEDKRWRELGVAARSFAEGIEAATAEDAFVKYAIALDVLLGREESGYAESQVTRISERLAFLLGEDDPDRRWRLFNAFKTLYAKRSGIVHGGATTNESELHRMEYIARLAILRTAWEIRYRGHDNLNALIDWVRRMKFGEAYVPIGVPSFLQLSDRWFEDSN